MTAVDSSVAIAGFASWHEAHHLAVDVLRAGATLPAHAAVEVYSVLTRLAEPHRAPAPLVAEFLARQFPRRLPLSAARQRSLVADLSRAGITGGACYDGVIGWTCHDAGERLVTLDVRAASTYERCGVDVELLGSAGVS